jgi:hypothetical protein
VRFVYIFYVSEHWELSWHIGHIVYCRKWFLIDKLIFLIHIDWIILRILIISWENFIILDFNRNWDDNTVGFVQATLFYIGFRFLQSWSICLYSILVLVSLIGTFIIGYIHYCQSEEMTQHMTWHKLVIFSTSSVCISGSINFCNLL